MLIPFTFLFYGERQTHADPSHKNLDDYADDNDLRCQMTLILKGRKNGASLNLSTAQRKPTPPTAWGVDARTVEIDAIQEHARTLREMGPRSGEPPMSDSDQNTSATLPCLQGNVARVGGGSLSLFPSPLLIELV